VPFRDLKGMLAYARANPGRLTVGTAGAGTAGHLSLEMLKLISGVELTHVPYKGNAPALTAILGGQVDLLLGIDAPAKAHIESGKLIGLATSGAQRWSFAPQLPTAAEAGAPGFVNSTWTAVAGPAKLPPELAGRIARAYGDALNAPEIRAKLEADGWAVRPGTPEQLAAQIRADIERMRPVIKAAGITP
jgi:tripartite-type tricarboxylate transporter receptor subunit TctC